jgi:glycosyltransferase involved in cell wall biosynthesis
MQGSSSPESALSVLVTGTSLFLRRHGHIFEALAPHFAQFEYLPERRLSHFDRAIYKLGSTLCRRAPRSVSSAIERLGAMHPYDARVFVARSLQLESQIAKLPKAPDLILHIFGMYCPLWTKPSIPYAMILDYTEALAYRNWRDWAPFASEESLRARLLCERRAYHNAVLLFPFGNATRRSLIEDYGVDPAKITVMGSAGYFTGSDTDLRTFGSKRILCYCGGGPDYYRKGGDRVLAAFRIVRQQIPDAKLAVVGGCSEMDGDPGVENYGYVSSPEKMRELFLNSDLVVAPARCDPFPTFLIEAMNFGLPCVTSDVDGIPEIVAHEVTGLVLSDTSGPQLAAEVIRLLNDPQRLAAMSRSGKKRAGEKFSSVRVARIVAEAIDRLPIRANVDPHPNQYRPGVNPSLIRHPS